MLDDEDLDFAILATPSGGGLVITIVSIFIVVFIALKVSSNHHKCSQIHCTNGQPILMNHECLCVEKAQ